MYSPQLNESQKAHENIQEFLGYNHNIRIGGAEFFDMKNMTSDHFPTLSPRKRRGMAKRIEYCSGIIAKDDLVYVDGNTVFYKVNGEEHSLTLDEQYEDRQLVSMGAYVIIYPDGVYVNTKDAADKGKILVENKTFDNPFKVACKTRDGEVINPTYVARDSSAYGGEAFDPSESYLAVRPKTYVVNLNDDYITPVGIPNTYTGDMSYQVTVEFFSVAGEDPPSDGWFTLEGSFDPYPVIAFSSEAKRLLRGSVDSEKGSYIAAITVAYRSDMGSGTVTHSVYATESKPSSVGFEDGETCTRVVDGDVVYSEYRAEDSSWSDIPTWVHFTTDGIGLSMEDRNFVRVTAKDTSVSFTLKGLLSKYSGEKKDSVGERVTDNEIAVSGCLTFPVTFETALNSLVSVETMAKMPVMDFVIESQNRLWGCRYGLDTFGSFVNEIYASELGNFKKWYTFEGTDNDSYAASVGSDGAFTGAINFQGRPTFFKENSIYKVYGGYPSAYQIVSDTAAGVQNGSHKSLVVMSNLLYYKAIDGVYRYDGSSQEKISAPLGAVDYYHGVAGGIDGKYYVSFEDDENAVIGRRTMFVFDSTKGMWHKEDDAEALFFVRHKGELYYYDGSLQWLISVKGTDGEPEKPVSWYADTGVIGYHYPDSKYISKIQLRVKLDFGSRINLFIEYDTDGYMEYIATLEGERFSAVSFPIVPRRCDHFRIRIEGVGEAKVFSMTKVIEEGGEQY